MDPQRRTLLVTGIVLLLILAIIFGTIFFLIRALTNRPASVSNNRTIFPTASTQPSGTAFPTATNDDSVFPNQRGLASPVPVASPRASAAPNVGSNVVGNSKVYNGPGFTLQYPNNWGLLTCSNSQNFEFDPTNSQDMLNQVCDFAVKPISVLVNSGTGCSGNVITLGSFQVRKQIQNVANGVNYKWCVQSTPALEISHRVSTTGGRATSPQDYSFQVEQMIGSFR